MQRKISFSKRWNYDVYNTQKRERKLGFAFAYVIAFSIIVWKYKRYCFINKRYGKLKVPLVILTIRRSQLSIKLL